MFCGAPVIILCHICCSFSLVPLYLYHIPLTVKADKASLRLLTFFFKWQQACVSMHAMLTACVWLVLVFLNASSDHTSWIYSHFVTLSWWLWSSGTQLPFGSSVFRSHLCQMPTDGGSRCGGFQSFCAQHLGCTWQDRDYEKIFPSVTLIAGWSSPVTYTMYQGRCLRSLVLNKQSLSSGDIFWVEITAGSFSVIIQV